MVSVWGEKKKKKQDYINFLPLTGCSNENLQIKYDSDLIGDFFFLAKKKKKKRTEYCHSSIGT